ncbi:hypothetical protein [Sphingopyxis sp. C-1]|uniref:hypothetical protein n=1 Tax=Sphingopyxis sp. C-1 TaxID=262667 RepID=UPI0006C64AAE|nr:hypothetical protein [Sphingopyxis sp. C-1]GAO78644.1 hypothetical protein SC1_01953 [Sphingopyxis sp. C-1]
MSFSAYSLTPSANLTLAGLSLAENSTALASYNNQMRQIMADGRELYNTVAALGNPLLLTGGTVTGNIIRSGFGGHYYANDSGHTGPRIYSLVDGSPAPSSPPAGSLVVYYAA